MQKTMALLLCCCLLLCAAPAAAESAYEAYLAGGETPRLAARYDGVFSVGIAVTPDTLSDEKAAALIAAQFDSVESGSGLYAEALMDRSSSRRSKDETRVKLNLGKAAPVLSFALENGMKVRARALVSCAHTPRWFFVEGWADKKGAKLVDRDTMLLRLENYIRDEMALVNEKYPGAVCAWDVVSDADDAGQENLWLETIGEDYAEFAFAFARKYAAEGQALFYHTDGTAGQAGLLASLREKGVLDGVSVQCAFALDGPDLSAWEASIAQYAELGLAVHLSDVNIESGDETALGLMRQAVRCRALFARLESLGVESVAFPALSEASMLFDAAYRCKPAFFGALQDGAIPVEDGETALLKAVQKLGLDILYAQEEEIVNVYKPLSQHNPVMTQRFGADPWAMVYDGRVYLYLTGDEPMFDKEGKIRTNDYSNITTLRVLSSDDLVNWQDHGSVCAAGRNGAAKWAGNSWAPCAAWKTIDGKDRFFLYFANSGGGIGVLTADSPAGPFTDPLGHALVSRATPTCAEVTWLFDPAVLVDSDGSAYLYFGGGIPNGRADDPGTARVVKLGGDMISLDGDPVPINPPWLFEDSGINKIGDTYVYSYCTNFNVPGTGSAQGFMSGEIVYMTSESPMGPFVYAGRVLQNPGAYFGVGGNNHHCMFEFDGGYYITYHAATLDRDMGWGAGYRSAFVDALALNADGLPALSTGTYAGVTQLRPFDPFRPVNGAVAASMAGVETRLLHSEDTKAGSGEMKAVSAAPGGWIGVAGVDFGENGASGIAVRFAAEQDAALEILLDSPDGEPAASLSLPAAADAQDIIFALTEPITGAHDLYFRFTASGTELLQWEFRK